MCVTRNPDTIVVKKKNHALLKDFVVSESKGDISLHKNLVLNESIGISPILDYKNMYIFHTNCCNWKDSSTCSRKIFLETKTILLKLLFDFQTMV